MSKSKLGVGLYSCKTHDAEKGTANGVAFINGGSDISNIIVDLDMQLKKLADHIKKNKIPAFGVQGIFVCPEYLFSKGDGNSERRGVPDYTKERIITQLKSLSQKYDRIIIIPGSICWETSPMGSGVANLSMGGGLSENEIKKKIPVLQAKENWSNSEVAFNVGSVADTGDAKLKNLDAAKNLGKKHLKASFQKNTVPILHNGKLVGEYHKSSDYKESQVDNTYHVPEPYPGLFRIKTHQGYLTIAIEVCLDHACKVLNSWLEASPTNNRPIIHVICSAWVQADYYGCKADGWLLHASSVPSATQLYRHNPNTNKSLTSPGILLDIIEVDVV